jgi:hypothetical protein
MAGFIAEFMAQPVGLLSRQVLTGTCRAPGLTKAL